MFRQGKSQEGQAMIEFVLGLMIVISFFFFYVRMCAVFAIGNYVHYATFMSARAYMSADSNKEKQKENATAVLQKMLERRFQSLIKAKGGDGSMTGATIGDGPYFADTPAQETWNQGVSFNYTSKLSLYPWSRENQSIVMDLTSESWMPREESNEECRETKGKVLAQIARGGLNNVNVEWDNASCE